MKIQNFLFLILLALFSSNAHALRFSLVGAGNYSEPKVAGIKYNPILDFGGGALLEVGLVPFVGLEFGALYLPRKYSYTTVIPIDTDITVTQKMTQFPVLLRAYLGELLSIGVGGYYAKYTGNIKVDYRVGPYTSSYTSAYGTQNMTTEDYGFVGSLAFYIPFTPLTRFLLDARYTVSAKDNNPSGAELKFNDIQGLVGLQIGF